MPDFALFALCVLFGICISCCVQGFVGFCKSKQKARENRRKVEVQNIAERAARIEFVNQKCIMLHNLRTDMTEYIDSKLAEKEGENETS